MTRSLLSHDVLRLLSFELHTHPEDDGRLRLQCRLHQKSAMQLDSHSFKKTLTEHRPKVLDYWQRPHQDGNNLSKSP